MTTVLYATTNAAKLAHMQRILAGLPVALCPLADMDALPPDVEETGRTPLENAIQKAKAYHAAYKMPVFSADSGLYFDGVPEALQPGVHVRRVDGRVLDDAEMVEYYSGFARRFGGGLAARYRNGLCLILADGSMYTSEDEALASAPFRLVATPHPHRVKGFPLDCLSADMETGQYFYDMQARNLDSAFQNAAFRRFFTQNLNLKEPKPE